MSICGSTETTSGEPCQWSPAESCPYHESGLSDQKERAAKLLRSGDYARYEVAQKCGVEPRTLRRWVNQHEELEQAADAGDEAQYQEVLHSWVDRLKEGDHSGAEMIFYLKNKRPDDWRDKRQHELSGRVAHEHDHEVSYDRRIQALRVLAGEAEAGPDHTSENGSRPLGVGEGDSGRGDSAGGRL